MISPFVFANWNFLELSSYLSTETEGDSYFFFKYISKAWRADPWVVKLVRVWEKIYIPKAQRKNFITAGLSALRRGGQGIVVRRHVSKVCSS